MLSVQIRSAKRSEDEALLQQSNLQAKLQLAESQMKQQELATLAAGKEAEDYRWEIQSLQKELKCEKEANAAKSMHNSYNYREVGPQRHCSCASLAPFQTRAFICSCLLVTQA